MSDASFILCLVGAGLIFSGAIRFAVSKLAREERVEPQYRMLKWGPGFVVAGVVILLLGVVFGLTGLI